MQNLDAGIYRLSHQRYRYIQSIENKISVMLDLEDERLHGLALHVVAWILVWTLCLNAVPAGASGRDHIIALNAAHGLVCTVSASLTIYYALDTTNSVAVSVAYFLVDLAAMVKADGLRKLHLVNNTRRMDYAHHVIGIFWGTIFFAREATVCVTSLGNPYVYIQTNEVSTLFYNWFRFSNSTLAGALFALTFFVSRIVFNTAYLIPRLLKECDTWYLYACMPYFALQYMWFAMIVKKMMRRSSPPKQQEKATEKTELKKQR